MSHWPAINSSVVSPKVFWGTKFFISVYSNCILYEIPPQHKMTKYSKNLGRSWSPWPSPVYAYSHQGSIHYKNGRVVYGGNNRRWALLTICASPKKVKRVYSKADPEPEQI